jgi:hypothetical protein
LPSAHGGVERQAVREGPREQAGHDDKHGAARRAVLEALREYAWQEEEHRVVFEALARVRSGDAISLREQLPAHATRMGFPEVEWQLYFAPSAGQNDWRELLRELLQRAGGR